MQKEVKMTVEQAKDLFKFNPEFRNTLLSVFTDDELEIDNFPKTFEDLKYIIGCSIDLENHLVRCTAISSSVPTSKNLFPTEKLAKSALAFAQLSQLAARVNGDWVPNWDNTFEYKYTVNHIHGSLKLDYYGTLINHIVFKTENLAKKSLKYHRQLWLDYYMIDEKQR